MTDIRLEFDDSGLDTIRPAFDELTEGSLYDLPETVLVVFSKISVVSAEIERYDIDLDDVSLPDTDTYPDWTITAECGKEELTITYRGEEFDTEYIVTVTRTCEFMADGTPGCCEKWYPKSRLHGRRGQDRPHGGGFTCGLPSL